MGIDEETRLEGLEDLAEKWSWDSRRGSLGGRRALELHTIGRSDGGRIQKRGCSREMKTSVGVASSRARGNLDVRVMRVLNS